MTRWQLWPVLTAVAVGIGVQGGLRDNLVKAQQTWEARKPSSYEFTIEVRCFCPGVAKTPPVFRVTAGKSSVVGELDAISQAFYESYNTVEKLFAAISRTLDRRQDGSTVEYDGALGFPVLADLDPVRDAVDDERHFRVTNFRVLENVK
jgi:hypothetical protein